jgi:WD40 repeat protein
MTEILDSILISSASDGTIKFWKIYLNSNNDKDNYYYLIQTIKAHESDAWKILYIQEAKQIVSCGSDSLIKIWNLNYIPKNDQNEKDIIIYEEKKILTEHKYWISSIIQVKNNEKNINYLVSGSGDTTIKFFDINKDYIYFHTIYKVLCCQQGTLVNYNNKTFLIGGGRGIFFYVVNFIHFQVEAKIFGGNEEVNTILVLKNNKLIHNGGFVVGGKECSFYYIYENSYNHKMIKKKAHEKYIYCLVQIGEDLIASSSYDNAIKIWRYNENTFK